MTPTDSCPTRQAVSSFVKKHPYATLLGIVGLLAASLILLIGFWQTFLIALFVALGIIAGSWLDGNRTIISCLKRAIDRMK